MINNLGFLLFFSALSSLFLASDSRAYGDLDVGRPVEKIGFSSDGKLLAASGQTFIQGEAVIKVWDTDRWQLKYAIKPNRNSVSDIAISPSSKLLALAIKDLEVAEVILYDANTGNELGRHIDKAKLNPRVDNAIWSIAFSPDEKRLAIGQASGDVKQVVRLLDIGNLRDITLAQSEVFSSSGKVGALSFSPNGRYLGLITSSMDDGRVVVIDLLSTKPVLDVKAFGAGHLVAFSPNGDRFAVSGRTYDRKSETLKNGLIIYDSVNWKQTKRFDNYPAGMEGLGFSHDGQFLAMGSQTTGVSNPEVLILDAKKAVPFKRLNVTPTFTAMAISPNGRFLAIGTAKGKVEIVRLDD